jgi:uncharacterized protein YbaR (Trm112 family)
MEEKLLDIACCPVTHQSLRKARTDELARANEALGSSAASGALQAGLVTEDGQRLYPVRDGLVSLLPDSAITIAELED